MVSALGRKLLRDLVGLRGQVLSIALVVASGIASFVALRSTWSSLHLSKTSYYERYRIADVFVHLERAPELLHERLEQLPGVAEAYTRVVEDVRIPLENVAQPPVGQIVSIPADGRPPLNGLFLESGRMVEHGRKDEALLLAKFAHRRGIRPGDVLPVVMRGVRRELRIVGLALSPEYVYPVAAGAGEFEMNEERVAVLWMDRDELAPLVRMEQAFNDVAVRLQPGASERAVRDELDALLVPYGGLGAIPLAEQPSNRILTNEMAQLESLATIVPAIFLGVAAFLLNMVLARLVLLQRTQIAALKALGYGDVRIGLHFLQLVLAIVLLGSIVGVALGAALGRPMTGLYVRVFGFPQLQYVLTAKVAATGVIVSAAAAFVGAIAVVRSVARLPPAEAMRPPPPALYRKTLLERLRLQRLISPADRMIVRELERRPLRTLAASLGFALAVAILVVARFYIDAIDYFLVLQFQEVQREDLVVTFLRPEPARALHELAVLPGVLHAEGMRAVPVRFEAGTRSRDGVLQGYPQGLSLRQLLDAKGEPIRLALGGVVLTDKLAEILGVRVGDRITVEVREGLRRSYMLPVVGLSHEITGLQGHLRIEELLALLGEQQGFSSALLRIDPDRREEVQRRLDLMPQVESVTSRAANLAHVRRQMGRTMIVMTLVATLFAATIAAGVVYNNARIALSVRSRDLASLRVIGFTRGEISRILLGEIGAQIAIALPVGLVLGRWLSGVVVASSAPENLRLPVIISSQTYAFAVLIALAVAALSALVVRARLDQLDLVGVLKTRE